MGAVSFFFFFVEKLVYYKFDYIGPINWCASNSILIDSFVEMSSYCYVILLVFCSKICSKFIFFFKKEKEKKKYNPITIKWMKNAKTNTNFTTKNLQTDMTWIWTMSLKQYNKWMFEKHFFFFILVICQFVKLI